MKPPWMEPRTAYIHVPFCAHHCGYCDFAVSAGQDNLITLYLDCLALELAGLETPRPVETLFIGGGTPTYLNSVQLAQLLESITTWHPPSSSRYLEFSIESTPDSLDAEKVAVLADFGVNRVSIGVQSFQTENLHSLDRRHNPTDIPRAIDAVRRRIANLSLDLIFAAPGATLETWKNDLTSALHFAPDHLSTYGLTYEKGTPLWKARRRGLVATVEEEIELAMYEYAIDQLGEEGFEHYEISNFSRVGYRCRHNERYWANEAYFGVGVGAARYIDGQRDLNIRDTKLYIRKVLAGESATFQSEILGNIERAFETIGTQLRRAEGIGRVRFLEQTGLDLDQLIGEPLQHLASEGLLMNSVDRVWLTRRGKCLADGVIEQLMKANVHFDGG